MCVKKVGEKMYKMKISLKKLNSESSTAGSGTFLKEKILEAKWLQHNNNKIIVKYKTRKNNFLL